VAEIETDKGIIDIESFVDGVVNEILVPIGEVVPVGTAIAMIQENGTRSTTETTSAIPPETAKPVSQSTTAPIVETPAGSFPGGLAGNLNVRAGDAFDRQAISPSARRLARELGVDPATVKGTGHGGAITRDDIELAAAATTAKPIEAEKTAEPSAAKKPVADGQMSRMRQTIAAAMSRSKREIPHYYLSHTIDMQPTMNWLAEENLKRPITERILYGVVLLKAVALALREVPELNSVWESNHAILKPSIHVGVAISLRQGGLIAPAIHDTDKKSLSQLMTEFRDLVNRARSQGLRSSELSDPTITMTSLGEKGVEAVFGVIYPPQTAIVGFGKVVERAWSINGGLMSRQVITASLSADHRVSDGHRGGLFLSAVERLLQEPEKL
jgi:pyruvate dehydrogenase E2 component (dihydrolipoamide acetyltransferase)